MNEVIESVSEEQIEETNQLAIGLVATGENDDAVARAVMRATAHDHPVFLTYTAETRPPLLDDINITNISIIPPVDKDPNDRIEPKDRLAVAAQNAENHGLIYLGEASSPIDYERLPATSEGDSFVVSGKPRANATSCEQLVAVPAYNEEQAIGSVVEAVQPHADDVVVIDDGSHDNTATKAKNAGATVIVHEYNKGYGAALQTAFETAAERDVECLVIIDGDGQHDTSDIPRVTEPVTDGNSNVAIGSRFMGAQTSAIPLYRRFGLQTINLLTNLSMGSVSPQNWVRDTQSGFRAYDRRSIELLAESDTIGNDMNASLDILYQLADADCTFEEVGTTIDYDVENASSQHPLQHGLTLVSTILRTVERDHPILTLGVPGFIFALGGLTTGYLTLANYIESSTFPFGLALLSVFLVLLGVFSSFTAIMLHSLQAHLEP